MSTYLELVQELHEEVGASGLVPAAVANQQGEAKRMVNWVRRADEYVQLLWHNWKFLRSEYDENTTVDVVQMPIVQGAQFWDEDTFKYYGSGGGTDPYQLEVVEYDAIKSEVRDQSKSEPYQVIIMPDNKLEVQPIPDDVYRITGDVYTRPVELQADDDISAIPEQYHRVILGRAMMLYANFESAPEIKTQGSEIYAETLTRLQNSQLPNKFLSQFRTGGIFEVIGSQSGDAF